MTEIAIFPIPGCVTFPHTNIPLHVFEPRYRQMIKDCLKDDRLLGVCDVQKEIKAAKPNQLLSEALNSNQATYKPKHIFSAGRCELINTLEDGRMHLNVNLEKRYELNTQTQTLPYVIADCTELPDLESKPSDRDTAETLKEKLVARLRALTSQIDEVSAVLNDDDWLASEPSVFSFKIFSLLRLDQYESQKILEMRSPVDRLAYLLEQLNKVRA